MLYIPFPFKRCSKCREYFPPTFDFFYRDKQRKYNQSTYCRNCIKKNAKIHHAKHPEIVRTRVKQWRIDNPEKARKNGRAYTERNRQKERERGKRYRQTHADQARDNKKRWRRNNPEKQRAATMRWQKENPERGIAASQRRRSRKNALPATLTQQEWQNALDYWHDCCAYCGNQASLFDHDPVLHREHFIPLSKGGAYVADNILPVCQSCNFGKADQDPLIWLNKRFGKYKSNQILKRIQEYFDSVKH